MKQVFFVTGTDTGVGKTWCSCQLLHAAAREGKRTLGLKPLASGAEPTTDGLRNEDARLLQQASTVRLPYEQVNPYCFADPVAPHLAAADSGTTLDAATLARQLRAVVDTTPADYILIEGAGGWRTPLNGQETLADVVKLLQVPVILVVGMKLGCLNHALLSAEAITADGLTLAGWIGNDLGIPMPRLADNLATLGHRLPAPRLLLPGQST